MRPVKSERLKKLETELKDLKDWLKLGLVPNRDIPKHKEEIGLVETKIDDEKARLQLLKETGTDDLPPVKRTPSKTSYTDLPTLPDIEESGGRGFTAAAADTELADEPEETRDHGTVSSATKDEDTVGAFDETDDNTDKDSFFDEGKRWERLGQERYLDPDADEW